MSKKNKVLKQLVKAQIQSGAQGTTSGVSLSGFQASAAINGAGTAPRTPVANIKEADEFKLIKKDIRLSVALIIIVIILLIVIYFLDRQYGFLLKAANLLMQKLKPS